jgi:hypothetical protein
MTSFSKQQALSYSIHLYKWLLLLYPTSFRQEFGQEMAHLFCDLYRDAWQQRGSQGLFFLWLATLKETAVTVPSEHFNEWKNNMKPKQTIPTLLGLALLAYSGFFVIFNVLKYNLGLPLPFDPFSGLSGSTNPTLWHIALNALVLFGPIVALALFLLPSVTLRVDLKSDQLLTVSLLKSGRLTLILIAACLGLLAVFFLYLLGENLPCLIGQQLIC